MSNLKSCSISLPMKHQQPLEQSIKLVQANESSKLRQQQYKQKIDNNIQKKPTSQIFQDASNLPQTHLLYLNNQGFANGSQQPSTTFGAKWSPVKATKVQADEDYVLTQRNQNLAGAQENIKNYQVMQRKSSKENTAQPVIAQNQYQAPQQKAFHHHKNFQSCGGINLAQFNNQINSPFCEYDNYQSPNQSVKNSRVTNNSLQTNNLILKRKDSGNLLSNKNGHLNETISPGGSNQNFQHNLNINNMSTLGLYNPLGNISSPLNQSVNQYLQSTRQDKQNEEVASRQSQKDQQKQASLRQISQSHRVSQAQSKSISNIQQIGIKLEQLSNPQSIQPEKIRSLTPNQRSNSNEVQNKIKKNSNGFLNNQLISSSSTRAQKQNFIQYNNHPMKLIEEESTQVDKIDNLAIKSNITTQKDKKIFSEDLYKTNTNQTPTKSFGFQGQQVQNQNVSQIHLQVAQSNRVSQQNNSISINTGTQTPQNACINQINQNCLNQQQFIPFSSNKKVNQQLQQPYQQQPQQQQYQPQQIQQSPQQTQMVQSKNQQQQQYSQNNLYQQFQNVQQQYTSTVSNSNNNNSINSSVNKFVFDQYCLQQKKLSTHDYGTNQNVATHQQSHQVSSQNLVMNNSTNNYNSNKIFNQSCQNFMIASSQNVPKSQVPNLNLNFEQSFLKIQNNIGSISNRCSTPSLLQSIISPQCRQQMAFANPLNDKSNIITPSNKFIPTNLQFQDGQNIGITTLLNNQINLNYQNKQINNNTQLQNSKSNNSNITTIISANTNNNNYQQKVQNNSNNNVSHQIEQNNTNNTKLNILLQQQAKDEQSLLNIFGCNQYDYEYTPRNQNTSAQKNTASQASNQKQQTPHHQSSKSLQGFGNSNNLAKNSDNSKGYFNVIQDIMKSVEKSNTENHIIQKTPKVEISLKSNTPSTPQINCLNASPCLVQKQQQKERQNISNIQLSSQQNTIKNISEVTQVSEFKQSSHILEEAIFKSNMKEKSNTEAIESNSFFPIEAYKNIRTEASCSNNGQQYQLQQTQQIKTEQSDSFYYYQSKRKYNVKDFEFIKLLGSGVFGQVHMVRDKKTKGIYALKLIDKQMVKEKEMETQLLRELNIHSQYSNHVNVLECLGYFEDEKYYYLLLEYASDGTCANLIENLPMKRLTEQQSCNIVKQILESINYLHKNQIIHRDLKLENILISNGKVKVCDFGCATFCDNPPYQRRRSFCGTLDYVSPEMIQDQIYDKEIDIWAIGVITFELCSGFAPFTQFNDQQTYQAIQNVKHTWPKCFSEELKDFIKKIFVVDPNQRATAGQLLYHDWILKHENINKKSA